MNIAFEGRGDRWSGAAEKAEPGDKDKFQPWSVRVSTTGGETVEGVMLVTDLAAEKAEADAGGAAGALGQAFSRALQAELGLRPLRSGFRFVVDHRWVVGYSRPGGGGGGSSGA